MALIELGRTDEARSLLDQAARQMPQDHALRPQLAELMVKIK